MYKITRDVGFFSSKISCFVAYKFAGPYIYRESSYLFSESKKFPKIKRKYKQIHYLYYKHWSRLKYPAKYNAAIRTIHIEKEE